jgi:CubicO group peptidase (beta-lactamase class C family)
MNEVLTPEQSAELKKSLRLPDMSRLLVEHGLQPAAFERYLDSRTALTNITGYPPDIVRKPDFPITPVDSEPLVHRTLDDDAFKEDMDSALKALTIAGYTVRVRRRGQTVFTLNGGSARQAPDPDPTSWDTTMKMHVASVSKLVTSMAVTKLLLEMGIKADTPIAGYLPSYFVIGPLAESITFRHLLTHTSGFRRRDEGGVNDGYTFAGFKMYFERGVKSADIGQWHYHNGNLSACGLPWRSWPAR